MKIDDIDRHLLHLLQEDSKLSVKDLASKLGLTKTPVYDRVRRLEESGMIKKYVAVLEQSMLPSYMVIFCSVSLESQKLESIESFRDAVLKFPEVLECYLMGGANDFLLKLIVKDLNDYHLFSSGKLAALSNISKIQSSFVLHEIKNSTILPIY
jgi:DNA-binding Lrp family transcriptional regulator